MVQARRKIQREAILHVARELFSQKGFDNTSLWDLAGPVKISDAQVLRLFGMKKRNILYEVLGSIWDDINAQVHQVIADSSKNAREKLYWVFHHVLNSLAQDHSLSLAFLSPVDSFLLTDEVIIAYHREFALLIDSIIQEGQQQNILRGDLNVHAIRQSIVGCIRINSRFGFLPRAEYDLEDALLAFEAILNGIAVA